MADETKKDLGYKPLRFQELLGTPLLDYKPLSFEALIEARQTVVDDHLNRIPAPHMGARAGSEDPVRKILYFVIDNPTSEEYAEKMRLGGRVQEVISAYEKATTPQQRYKAQSELCRLVDRISGGAGGIAQGIQSGDKRYFVHYEMQGEQRVPKLEVIEGIGPAQLSRRELDLIFRDKSGSMPSPRTPEEEQRISEEIFDQLFDISSSFARKYYFGTSREEQDGRNVGVKKEKK